MFIFSAMNVQLICANCSTFCGVILQHFLKWNHCQYRNSASAYSICCKLYIYTCRPLRKMIKYADMQFNATSWGSKTASCQVVNTARGYPSFP